MKAFSYTAALLGLLVPALSVAAQEQKKIKLPINFQPPQVFKNANLVHVISLEKNYVKEQINVLVENVSKQPQSEYFVVFPAEKIESIGGFEVKDRKDSNLGPFVSAPVDFDPRNELQYYRVTLPSPLKAGAQQTLGITFFHLKAYRPLPASITQDGQQFLVYDFSAYASSAYPTLKQKTEIKAASSSIPDYTTIDARDGDAKSPQKQGTKLTYGPFGEKPPGASFPAQVRFEFTKPVTHVSLLERDVEVSHWGGNVAFEERYVLNHRGANLSAPFNRAKWAQAQFYSPASSALKELRMPLQVGSLDPYFTDTIGNVTTSRFRSNKREALLELKPRFPLFGGWKYPFTVGWNADAAQLLRKTGGDGHVLKIPFLEGPKQVEGIEYGEIRVQVLLPEGAENVKFSVDLPESSITESTVGVHKTFLDTIGRTSVTIRAQNLVDEFRDRNLIITYDTTLASTLRKPIFVFLSMLSLFASAWVIGTVKVGFEKK